MTFLDRIISYTTKFENPKYPLLGPNLKGLYFFGLWYTGNRTRATIWTCIHFSTFVFIISEFVDLYSVRDDINKVLNNFSLTILSVICLAKCCSLVICQRYWRKLVEDISEQERMQIEDEDPVTKKHMEKYTKYARIVTFLFWVVVFMTNFLLIITPLLKYFSSKTYRNDIAMGVEPFPQIMCSWFPFDNTKMPGYLGGVMVHVFMSSQGAGVLATYDMMAVAILSFLKGQLMMLKEKCNNIFGQATSSQEILDRIRDCHRHHNFLIKVQSNLNSLLSPTMFLYVLLCSMTICGSVVQLTSKEVSTSQKLWVMQYASGLVFQLFLYCWHSNEVTIQSLEVDRGVYYSDWWKGDVRIRKQLLLLAGKLARPFVLDAGPYTTLSVPTFIEIMKGSYSFFTIFSQMQED